MLIFFSKLFISHLIDVMKVTHLKYPHAIEKLIYIKYYNLLSCKMLAQMFHIHLLAGKEAD